MLYIHSTISMLMLWSSVASISEPLELLSAMPMIYCSTVRGFRVCFRKRRAASDTVQQYSTVGTVVPYNNVWHRWQAIQCDLVDPYHGPYPGFGFGFGSLCRGKFVMKQLSKIPHIWSLPMSVCRFVHHLLCGILPMQWALVNERPTALFGNLLSGDE